MERRRPSSSSSMSRRSKRRTSTSTLPRSVIDAPPLLRSLPILCLSFITALSAFHRDPLPRHSLYEVRSLSTSSFILSHRSMHPPRPSGLGVQCSNSSRMHMSFDDSTLDLCLTLDTLSVRACSGVGCGTACENRCAIVAPPIAAHHLLRPVCREERQERLSAADSYRA
jgi:hypothetical protein